MFDRIVGTKRVFIRYPETEAEARQLQTLAHEVRFICSRTSRTDLWISGEFSISGRTGLVTSLYARVALTADALASFEAEVRCRLGEVQ